MSKLGFAAACSLQSAKVPFLCRTWQDPFPRRWLTDWLAAEYLDGEPTWFAYKTKVR